MADRLRDWISSNPLPVLAGAALVLAAAGAFGGWRAWSAGREDRASLAAAEVERDYLKAMGAAPGSVEIVEPANPETGKNVRREYSEKFLAVAAEHPRSRAAWSARIAAGDLLLAAGEIERAIEVWNEAVATLDRADAGRGLALQRIASAHENAGRWKDAGEAYAAAGEVPGFPLRTYTLAQAARSFVEAGDTERAIAIARTLELQPGDTTLPGHLQALIGDLRARGGLGAQAAGAPPAAEPPAAAAGAPAP